MPKLLSIFLQISDDINRDRLLSKEIALKKIIVVFATILITIILGFFVIPEISYTFQIKSIISSELNNGNIVYKATNQKTKFFYKHLGPYLWNPHIISINHFPFNYYD